MRTIKLILAFSFLIFLTSCSEEDQGTITCTVDEDTIQDLDGNCYQIVKISEQFWMAENLRTTKTKDGSNIRNFNEPSSPGGSNAGYVHYENDPKYNDTFGKLYNVSAICCDICPNGWKLPSPEDWIIMITNLGGFQEAGAKLKLSSAWPDNEFTGNNESGFSAYPASGYSGSSGFFSPDFTTWWTTDIDFFGNRTVFFIGEAYSGINRTYDFGPGSFFSVRCIKEN